MILQAVNRPFEAHIFQLGQEINPAGFKEKYGVHATDDMVNAYHGTQEELRRSNGELEGKIIQADMKTAARRENNASAHEGAGGRKGGQLAYSVQVGAFKMEPNADRFAEKLKEKGYDAFVIVDRFENGKSLHRIMVGRYPTRSEALADLEFLKSRENIIGFVAPLK